LVVSQTDEDFVKLSEQLRRFPAVKTPVDRAFDTTEASAKLARDVHDACIVSLTSSTASKEIVAWLRSTTASLSIPVVLLTGAADEAGELEARRAGADVAPLSVPSEVEEGVKRALVKGRALRRLKRTEALFRALVERSPSGAIVLFGTTI